MRSILLLLWGLSLAAPAWGQSAPFAPQANPVSNQAYDAAAISVGAAFVRVSRAIYNGNSAACNLTVTTNGGTSVAFQNAQPGEFLPIQATIVTASTCSNLVVLY